MLRKVRIALALVFITGLTLLFVGIGREWWGWMAKLQFLPSCLALNLGVMAGIIVLTLLLGRIYCSVICPMGVFQDCVIWLRRMLGLRLDKVQTKKALKYARERKENKTDADKPVLKRYVKHFAYHREHKVARNAVLTLFIIAMLCGLQVFIALIAPYSAYGRMVRSVFGIVTGESAAWSVTLVALTTLVAIFLCAWFWGREYCNTICPVGTLLSLFSRYSMFRIQIDADKCKACGRCGRGCKASCIDMDAHTVDYTRCVDCFDCIDRCKEGAVKYRFAWKRKAARKTVSARKEEVPDTGRRAFLVGAAVLGSSAVAKADGGLARILPKEAPQRSTRLVPPGACSLDDFYSRCTACGLCISNCPNKVLRASTDLRHLMQPQMGYENGWCRPECTVCSEVCPTGAILKIVPEQKTAIKIGTALVNPEVCLAATGQAKCGACSHRCPTGAIMMVETENGRRPVVAEEICTGCGACENGCPVRPVSAITVNGLSTHQIKE